MKKSATDAAQRATIRHWRTAFFTGVGSAFVLFPTPSLYATHAVRESAPTRMAQAFARVGSALTTSMDETADEQTETPRSRRR